MGRFDADSSALAERAALNAARTAHDLEAWIFDHVRPVDGMRIADLGCGTGKQIFALARRLSASTEIVGIDISESAVSEVRARARREGLSHVHALRASLDECPAVLPGGAFDLVLSTYAIYYADDVVALLGRIAGVLNPGGQMFVCGPAAGTNREMIDLVNRLEPEERVADVEDFLDADAIASLGHSYASVSRSRMTNTATFTSAAETMTWWRNHNMYRPDVDEDVRRELDRIFAIEPTFRLTKNVLGVHGRV